MRIETAVLPPSETFPTSPDSLPCFYVPPTQISFGDVFFATLRALGQLPGQNFENIKEFFGENVQSHNTFQFKFPLKDTQQAEYFIKTMWIKTQQAHRFVPVFTDCRYKERTHLGFIREVDILDGPTIREHVVVDPNSPAVIFIEESQELPNGVVIPGGFAALNSVIQEDGYWYFACTYVYSQAPQDQVVEERKEMFRETHRRMLSFIESGETETVYQELMQFGS
jgi:hypothetical protein